MNRKIDFNDAMLARLLSFSFLFFLLTADAQDSATKKVFLTDYNAIQQYSNRQNTGLLLYNGIEYAHPYPHTIGHPFVFTDSFKLASLLYDGVLYTDVPLNYNVTSNCVVIQNKDKFFIELVNEKVNSFVLNDHVFISLSVIDTKGEMPAGIYEWYHYTAAGVFIHYQKVVQSGSNAADPDHFTSYNEIYVQIGDDVFHIKGAKDLMKVFADKQSEIRSYLRQGHLNFKRKPEETVVKATAYYAQLKTK